MANIDPTKPTTGRALTQDVRDNFQACIDQDTLLQDQINGNDADIAALDGRISQNESDIILHDGRITQNTSDIAVNKSDITQNASDIATKVNKAGDTMTGNLNAPQVEASQAAPTQPQHLTRKDYVDSLSPLPATLAKAWVRFNGTGTVTIEDSFNVSSITDNGVGVYTVNFTNNLPNTNYAYMGVGRRNNATDRPVSLSSGTDASHNPSVSSIYFGTWVHAAAAYEDPLDFSFVVFADN